MSDLEDDLDDQLLALAGEGDKKRKRRSNAPKSSSGSTSSSKKRRADPVHSNSDVEPESEEEVDLYPIEGKYVDEADRNRLLQMSEFEREEILASRAEEKQRQADRRILSQMVKNQRAGVDADGVAQAAKRQHTARGATKEKSRKLDELKAKRKAKDEKKRSRNFSPKRERTSSPMDMEISDEESEDGQITKYEQEEERERKLFSKPEPDEQPVKLEDLEKCRLTRDLLVKHSLAPWFEDYVKGAWVRYLIGQEGNQPVYRMCEIQNLAADFVKPYKINEKTVNQALELKHGKSARLFLMDKVSNGNFVEKEFDRLVKVCAAEDVKLPSKRTLEEKVAQLHKLSTQPMTESDINAMLARKSKLQANKSATTTTMERSRLNQARTLALRRQDYKEVAEIDAQLAELGISSTMSPDRQAATDVLAKVNERNRKANLEAVRKAEMAETERKRRERKLAASGGGSPAPSDPSARLKTKPRMFNAATPISRPSTPQQSSVGIRTETVAVVDVVRSEKTLEAALLESVEIDLGDF